MGMYICMCMHICVCIWICVYMWRPMVDVWDSSSASLSPYIGPINQRVLAPARSEDSLPLPSKVGVISRSPWLPSFMSPRDLSHGLYTCVSSTLSTGSSLQTRVYVLMVWVNNLKAVIFLLHQELSRSKSTGHLLKMKVLRPSTDRLSRKSMVGTGSKSSAATHSI